MSDDTDTDGWGDGTVPEESVAEVQSQARFGTFGGVFTPCTLTILGVIMFMRSSSVVGDVGVWRALIILAIAKAITMLTTLSLSAIATNTEVRTGGVYYMISRTLGADFGGTIGLTLFVSQAISIAFYVIGFAEALFLLIPDYASSPLPQIVSTITILVLFGVTFKGADVAIKAQYPILAVLLASVISFVVGGVLAFDGDNFAAAEGINPSGDGFWLMFAVFFPAATGITAGANMSGDLKNPARSIPRGTLVSIGFTAAIYVLQLILLAGFASQEELLSKPFKSLQSMSVVAPLIIAGVFAATLSSALGSFLGAPRILQAMGQDRLLKPLIYFGKGEGPTGEPRRATILTLGIALVVVWSGDLNAVAGIISMFFLIAYGMINFSAFVEGRGGNPSFRPRFKAFGWPAALAGTVGCAIAMVKIDETAAIVAILIAATIYFSLRGRTVGDWVDAKRGYIFKRTRENLLLLEKTPPDTKNWRSAMAVLSDDVERDKQMVDCASWIEAGRGLLSILEVRSEPELELEQKLGARKERLDEVKRLLAANSVTALADSVIVGDSSASLDTVLQSYSIGSLRPNTIMVTVPPPSQTERRKKLDEFLKTVAAFDLNILVYKGARIEDKPKARIDLWWHGQQNGSLMAMFAYLTSTHPSWSKAKIRMLRVVKTPGEHLEAEESLEALMHAARMKMQLEVVLSDKPISELIADRSSSSDLVLLGLARSDVWDFQGFLATRDELLTKLPPTLLVLSNGEVDLLA